MSIESTVICATFSAHFSPTAEAADHRAADLRWVLQLCGRLAAKALRQRGGGGWGADDVDYVAMVVLDKVGRKVQAHGGMGFLGAPEAALSYLQTAVINVVRDDRRRHRVASHRVRAEPGLLSWSWGGAAQERRISRLCGAMGSTCAPLRSAAEAAQLDAQAVVWLFEVALPELAAARPGIADRLRVLRAYAEARQAAGPDWEAAFAHRFGAPWSPALRSKMGRGRQDLVEALDAQLRALAGDLWLDAADLTDPEAIYAAYAALRAAAAGRPAEADGRSPAEGRAALPLRFCRAALARLWVAEHLRERAAQR
jgi:hypothetical protein